MKKNIMIATGLLSAVVPVVLNNESQAVDDLKEFNEKSRTVTTMNKIGKVKGVASNDTLNVRKEPKTGSSVVFTLKNSTVINIIGQDIETGWYKISYNNNVGYASNRYIEITGDTYTKYTVTGDINIRKEPNWSSEKVAVAKKGEILNVISIANDWAKVSYNNSIYYAPSNYLTKDSVDIEEDVPSNDTDVSVSNYEVTADINIRKESSWSAEKVAVVKKGEILNVISIANDWAKVSYNNSTCYAPANYLTKISSEDIVTPPDTEENPVEKTQIATVNTNDLNIRSGADTIYPILSKVNKGDIVLIKDSNMNGWYKVQLKNGVIGWCNGLYLENFREGSITVTPGDDTPSTDVREAINKVISLARAQIGKPYVYGSAGPNSFDCSGLSYYVFKNGANITLPRNSKAQATVGKYVSKTDLQPGDLVFFNTSGSGISHLGIYIGNDEMIHAPSSGKNVQIVKITQSYWANRYVTARRVIY